MTKFRFPRMWFEWSSGSERQIGCHCKEVHLSPGMACQSLWKEDNLLPATLKASCLFLFENYRHFLESPLAAAHSLTCIFQAQLTHSLGTGEESISKAKQSRSEKKARKVCTWSIPSCMPRVSRTPSFPDLVYGRSAGVVTETLM